MAVHRRVTRWIRLSGRRSYRPFTFARHSARPDERHIIGGSDGSSGKAGGFMGRFEGVEAIREHFSGVSSIMEFAIHHVTNPLITITDDDPDAATGLWYLWQPCTQTTRRETA